MSEGSGAPEIPVNQPEAPKYKRPGFLTKLAVAFVPGGLGAINALESIHDNLAVPSGDLRRTVAEPISGEKTSNLSQPPLQPKSK